ncbi:hypothetical protein C8Q78DRAFT_388750 [Trametes maxima]|nr:hypothetical protein C8Q78DRAFT_388750 [Trametes maxima]
MLHGFYDQDPMIFPLTAGGAAQTTSWAADGRRAIESIPTRSSGSVSPSTTRSVQRSRCSARRDGCIRRRRPCAPKVRGRFGELLSTAACAHMRVNDDQRAAGTSVRGAPAVTAGHGAHFSSFGVHCIGGGAEAGSTPRGARAGLEESPGAWMEQGLRDWSWAVRQHASTPTVTIVEVVLMCAEYYSTDAIVVVADGRLFCMMLPCRRVLSQSCDSCHDRATDAIPSIRSV